jgi:hypothetical protein
MGDVLAQGREPEDLRCWSVRMLAPTRGTAAPLFEETQSLVLQMYIVSGSLLKECQRESGEMLLQSRELNV